MGKGTIISGGEDGLYQVKIIHNLDRYDFLMAGLNTKKTELEKNRVPVQEEYNDKDYEVGVCTQQYGLLIGELEDLYSDHAARQAELKSLRSQLQALEDDLRQLREELEFLIEIEASEQVIAAKQAEIDAKEVQITNKQTEITEKQEEITDSSGEIDKKSAEATAKEKELQNLSLERAFIQSDLDIIDLELAAIDKKIQYIDDNKPEDDTTSAWCCDLTEDIEGDVGTIEIPGERGEQGIVQIQPGFFDESVYDPARDGQMYPTSLMSAAQAFYNYALLPGWQKWLPTFRHGTVTGIVDRKINLTLDASVVSSAQDIIINRVPTLTGVEVEYMMCDAGAFKVGDEILIKFEPNSSATNSLNELQALKDDLLALRVELGNLKIELNKLIGRDRDQIQSEINKIGEQLETCAYELYYLQQADPIDQVAIDEKEEEIAQLLLDLEAKEEDKEDHEGVIVEKEEEITAKEEQISTKKEEIDQKQKSIAANMADFAVPTVIGFKEEPKSCSTYTGIIASTNDYASLDDDKIYEWHQGDSVLGAPGSSVYIYTPLPDNTKDYNNSWVNGSKIKMGGKWKYPWMPEEDKDIRMRIKIYILTYNEAGSIVDAIPIKVNYEPATYTPKDKMIAGGTGADEFIFRTSHLGPNDIGAYPYNSSCGSIWDGIYGELVYTGWSNTTHWDVWGLNGMEESYYPLYRLSWQQVELTWVQALWNERYGPVSVGDIWGYSIGGLGEGAEDCGMVDQRSPGCYGIGEVVAGISCWEKEQVGWDEFMAVDPTDPHPCLLDAGGDLDSLYLEQEWSMEGIITETGVILTDVSGEDIVIDIEDITLPVGSYSGINATQGDVNWTSLAGKTEIHHVGFAVSAYITDNNTHAAMIKRHLPNPSHWYREFEPFYEEYTDDGHMECYCVICPTEGE